MAVERNKCLYEVHWGRAQWLATDDQLTVRDLVEALIEIGKDPNSIYIRTGDDALDDPVIQANVQTLAEHTGVKAIH